MRSVLSIIYTALADPNQLLAPEIWSIHPAASVVQLPASHPTKHPVAGTIHLSSPMKLHDLARDSVQNIPNESRFCWVCLAKLVETSHIPHPKNVALFGLAAMGPMGQQQPGFWCCIVLEIISQRSHQHLPIFPGRVRNLSTGSPGSAARPSQRTPSFWIIIK